MKKKLLCAWTLIVACLALMPPSLSAQTYWDGTSDKNWEGLGTAASPYLISSVEELAGLAARTNAGETFEGVCFRLTADLYLSNPETPDDDKPLWEPIGAYLLQNDDPEQNAGGFYAVEHWFKGSFDGGGHTIYNLWYTGTTDFDDWNDPFGSGQLDFTAWNKALFGLTDGASISNLNVENANVAGTALIGGLAVRVKNSRFADISVSGHIKSGNIDEGGSAAGIAVEAENSHFVRCTSSASVFGKSNTGCLIGCLRGASTVEHCSAGGEATGCINIGGLIGASTWIEGDEAQETPEIRFSTSTASVTVIVGRNQGNAGAGFIGMNAGRIYGCGATGKVNLLADAAAGFCYDNYGHIETCYATAEVGREDYGGYLSAFVVNNGIDVGYEKYSGTILNCYGAGRVYAAAPPDGVVTNGTHIAGFVSGHALSAGAYLANCYYDCTLVPEIEVPGRPGEYGRPTDFMKSKEFVDSLNMMAAVMGTHLWQYNPSAYPTPIDVLATDITPFFGGGTGAEADPFLVETKQHLKNLAYATNAGWEFRGQYLRQTADIALNAPMDEWGEQMPEAWTPIGRYADNTMNQWAHHFSGTYDGGLHTVRNLYIDDNAAQSAGLFGVLGSNAVIKNLGVEDAWVNGGENVGILLGSTNLQNDPCAEGPRTVSHCWTSGSVTGGTACGGIVGRSWGGGDPFTMSACYSTAEARRGLIGDNYTTGCRVNGSWFGGTVPSSSGNAWAFANYNEYFYTFVDCDKNVVKEENTKDYPFGRTTAYMQGKQFVNDLNYAAAAKGDTGGWGYNAGGYPSFAGEQPTLQVTLNDGVTEPVTFLAIEGSSLSMPETAEREGYTLEGWYTDEEYTAAFHFGHTLVTEPLALYAKWIQPIESDYEVFKNKFSKTYTLTTAAQLYALANIVNGTAESIAQSDFSGKTVKLGADIELNDISLFDLWGTSVTPARFTAVGNSESYPFNGTFDGAGHSIKGLYVYCPDYGTDRYGFFGYLGQEAVVKDLVIEKGCIVKQEAQDAGLLAAQSKGSVQRCGAEGKIICKGYKGGYANGGLIGVAAAGSSVSQSYALVDMDVWGDKCGGLIGTLQGALDNSFARGAANYRQEGAFGGLVGSYEGEGYTNCYSAVSVDLASISYSAAVVGGSYGSGPWGTASNPGIYDRDLVSVAFNKLPEEYISAAYNKGTGLTTAEMKKMSSYAGWDFTSIWGRREDKNGGYPYLRWAAPGLDNDPDSVVDTIGSVRFDANEQVEAFTPQGLCVYSGPLRDARLSRGIYILRGKNGAAKVAVK